MAIGKSKLHGMLRRGRTLSDAEAWLKAFTPQNKKQILDWLRIDQLRNKGVDSEGNIIGYYSRATEIISQGRKRAGEPYTLEDTGAFYESLFIVVLTDSLVIEGDVDKFKDQNWYTDKIIGLTDENFSKLLDMVKAEYVRYCRELLFNY